MMHLLALVEVITLIPLMSQQSNRSRLAKVCIDSICEKRVQASFSLSGDLFNAFLNRVG